MTFIKLPHAYSTVKKTSVCCVPALCWLATTITAPDDSTSIIATHSHSRVQDLSMTQLKQPGQYTKLIGRALSNRSACCASLFGFKSSLFT